MRLGAKIHCLRTEHQLSQEALADLVGVSRQSVSKWETDASVPDLDRLVKLSEIFQISLDELIAGKLPENNTKTDPVFQEMPVPSGKPSRQHTAALVLLSIWGGITLLSFLFGGLPAVFWNSLLLGSPLLVCGLICLLVRRHVGLWCGWGVYFCVEFFIRFATGINWQDVRFMFLGLGEINPVRLVIAWLSLLFLLTLMITTLRAFRGPQLRLTNKQAVFYILAWAIWAVLQTPMLWRHLPAFSSTFLWLVQDDLPMVLLTALLVILMRILPPLRKK